MQTNLEILKQTKYLFFIIKEHKPKTKIIAVVNKKSEEEIGEIRWYSPWRQYCFYPCANTIWNNDCLIEVNQLLNELKSNRKTKKQTIAVVAHTVNDFLTWKQQKGHRKSTGLKRRYTRGNKEYICMTRPRDAHGYAIDKVIETEQAYLNPKIFEIMKVLQHCMVSNKN